MRRVLYVVLILLLPLRAWVGDAMATQMAVPAPVSLETSAGPSYHGDQAASPAHGHLQSAAVQSTAGDCAGHAQADQGDMAHCATCAMCQTCHTLAVLHPDAVPDAGLAIAALPQRAVHRFTSADRAPALKPPVA